MPGRVVEEIAGGRRLVREYDEAGKLLRIRLLPLSRGATTELPPIERAPPPELSRSSAARALFGRKREEAPAPPAPVEEPPAPALPSPPRIHVRFEDEPPTAVDGIEVVVEPLPVVFRFSPPPVVAAPEPEPAPAPIVFVEPEPPAPPEPEPPAAVDEPPAPIPLVAEAAPEPARPLAFEVVAIEPLAEPEPPEPVVVPEPEPSPAPEPAPPEPVALQEERAPEPVATLEAREPDPPISYAALVPDVDQKVDAVLARQDAPDKRRKRAPLPAPAFEPLKREPWEDRLDEVLGR